MYISMNNRTIDLRSIHSSQSISALLKVLNGSSSLLAVYYIIWKRLIGKAPCSLLLSEY